MNLPITTIFALALTMVMLGLWINVAKLRAASGVSIGDGGNDVLHEKIRRHGNFMEWVPVTLVLLALAELQGASAMLLSIAGALALAGRLIHPFGLRADNAGHPLRIVGNTANTAAVLVLLFLLMKTVVAS